MKRTYSLFITTDELLKKNQSIARCAGLHTLCVSLRTTQTVSVRIPTLTHIHDPKRVSVVYEPEMITLEKASVSPELHHVYVSLTLTAKELGSTRS